jgi:predicted ATPase
VEGPGAQTIALAPLSGAESSALLVELLGSDPSVGQIGEIISERAAGNPFFAQEITRELAERGVLEGERGNYTCHTDVAEITVPASLQATLAACIDRLSRRPNKRLPRRRSSEFASARNSLSPWKSIPASTSRRRLTAILVRRN